MRTFQLLLILTSAITLVAQQGPDPARLPEPGRPAPAGKARVAEGEIRTAKPVEFRNNPGRSGRQDSPREIEGIGTTLASRNSVSRGRYTMSRYPAAADRLGADILGVGSKAQVDHIKNIRRILTSYLMKTYGYDRESAESIAVFATYYNAVHRGDMAFFTSKYTTAVSNALRPQSAGIDTDYREWPGKTQLVIPVSAGGVSAKDVADDETLKKVKSKDDKGLPERKKLTELREQQLEKEKTEVRKEEEKLKSDEKKLESDQKKTEEEKREVEQKRTEAKKETDPEKKKQKEEEVKKGEEKVKSQEKKNEGEKKKIEEKKTLLEQMKDDVKKEEKKIAEEKKQIEADKKEVAKSNDPKALQSELKEKDSQLKKKEEELKKVQEEAKKDIEAAREKNIIGDKMYYLRVLDYGASGQYNNAMYLLDPKNLKVLLKSPYPNIASRQYAVSDTGVIVIGRTDSEKFLNTSYHLVQLDKNSLVPLKLGKERIFWRSFVEIRSDSIYAITIDENRYYLSRFDRSLQETARSKIEVHEDTFFTMFEDKIYINAKDRKIAGLNAVTLEKVNEIAAE